MNQVFNQSLRLYRTARLPDGQGGFVETPALVASGPGLARPLSMRDAVLGGYEVGTSIVRFYTEASFDARVGDTIRCDSNERDYRVVGVKDPNEMGHHLEIETVETK